MQWLKLPAWKVEDRGLATPLSIVFKYQKNTRRDQYIVGGGGGLRDQEVAYNKKNIIY